MLVRGWAPIVIGFLDECAGEAGGGGVVAVVPVVHVDEGRDLRGEGVFLIDPKLNSLFLNRPTPFLGESAVVEYSVEGSDPVVPVVDSECELHLVTEPRLRPEAKVSLLSRAAASGSLVSKAPKNESGASTCARGSLGRSELERRPAPYAASRS